MGRLLVVCLGGAIGSGARYLASGWATRALPPGLPWGTVIVNVTGSFYIAVVMGLALRTALVGPDLRLFLTTGIAGGYTTYSSFNWETLRLFQAGAYLLGAANVALTVVLCAAGGLLGLAAVRGATRAMGRLLSRGED